MVIFRLDVTAIAREAMQRYVVPEWRYFFLLDINNIFNYVIEGIARGGYIGDHALVDDDGNPWLAEEHWDDFIDGLEQQIRDRISEEVLEDNTGIDSPRPVKARRFYTDIDYETSDVKLLLVDLELHHDLYAKSLVHHTHDV